MSEPVVVHHLIIPPEETEKLVSQAENVYLRDYPCRARHVYAKKGQSVHFAIAVKGNCIPIPSLQSQDCRIGLS